MSMVLLSCL